MRPRGFMILMTVVLATLSLLPFALLANSWRLSWSGNLPDRVWGQRGVADGQLLKPRGITIDQQDQLYVVDMTARIQVFDLDGKFLRGFRTPKWDLGKPTGISIDRDGNVVVPDTHYHRVLFFTPEGQLLPERTIGGTLGSGPSEFGFVTDVVQDSLGNYYVSEYGENDRIQKFNSDGVYLLQWGSHGSKPGQFRRPQSMAIDNQDRIWVADACNHRIQVFNLHDQPPALVMGIGCEGMEPGQFRYPYGLVITQRQDVYVSELGNHRVQKFTIQGKFVDVWGHAGRAPGELHGPWGVAADRFGRIHGLDTYNHRVQRVRF